MSEIDNIRTLDAGSTSIDRKQALASPVTVRVSPHSYLAAILLMTFVSALLFYLEIDHFGYVLFLFSWVVIPFLALRDRISFDGRVLRRTGILPRAWSWLMASRRRLKLSDIEQVDTHAVRALKRGGNIYYRYRTVLRGKGLSITIVSGGDGYRKMIQSILLGLDADTLDLRSAELASSLKDPKETVMKAEFARIPSASLLTPSFVEGRVPEHLPAEPNAERAEELHQLANELRVEGHLAQALEAFRRAIRLRPRSGRLLFDAARCLYAFGTVERDAKLQRMAIAGLRLSARGSTADSDLLSRIGEYYFELGDLRRASRLFQSAIDRAGNNFRAARGMAELALREGKLAHVIHQFESADRAAATPALRRWSRGEADYFSHLHRDDEYMEMEISRVNLLDGLQRSKKTALRIASLAFPLVIVGLVFEDTTVANVGWSVSTVALFVWLGLIVAARMFLHRIPYELMESEED